MISVSSKYGIWEDVTGRLALSSSSLFQPAPLLVQALTLPYFPHFQVGFILGIIILLYNNRNNIGIINILFYIDIRNITKQDTPKWG